MILTLHIHWRGEPARTVPVESLIEASRRFCESRNAGSFGSSQMRPKCGFLTDGGRTVAHVSYNGKVWKGRPRDWNTSSRPLYEPGSETPKSEASKWGGYAESIIKVPGIYDGIDVHGVRSVEEGGFFDVNIDDDDPEFFSVYIHLIGGGVECVGDFENENDADNYAHDLHMQYGWPIR